VDINWAILQVQFIGLTRVISDALIVIPALVGAIVLISIGFAIAVYLREIIEDAEVTDWRVLSMYLYYFILFVSGVYALNLALISIPFSIRGWILVVASVIISIAVGYKIVKNFNPTKNN
jgi:hydrogenase maturation factor